MTQYSPQALQPQAIAKHIPAGKYIAIDETYYRPKEEFVLKQEAYGSMGMPLLPHGKNVTYQPSPFVRRQLPLNMTQKINYNTYIYNQLTGY